MLAIRAARAVARRPVLVGAVGVGGAVAYSAKRSGNSPAFYWCGGVETSFARLPLQFLPLRTAACASNIKPYDDDDDDDDDDEEPGFFARNYTVLLTSGGVIVSYLCNEYLNGGVAFLLGVASGGLLGFGGGVLVGIETGLELAREAEEDEVD
eukprot:m.450037 g.450037  ORF g.450037 m.450037 type:complete len:153 (-) comp19907_c0_seq1:48-506(-)